MVSGSALLVLWYRCAINDVHDDVQYAASSSQTRDTLLHFLLHAMNLYLFATATAATTTSSGRLSWTPTGSNASKWTSNKIDHAQWFSNCQTDDTCKPFFEPFQKYLPQYGQNCTISDVIHASVDVGLDVDTGEPLSTTLQASGLSPTLQHFRKTKCGSSLITHQGACVWHNESYATLPVWYNATNATDAENTTGTYIGSLLVNRTEVCTTGGVTQLYGGFTNIAAYSPPSPPPGGDARRSQLMRACLLDPGRLPIECTQRDALFGFFDATGGSEWASPHARQFSSIQGWEWTEDSFPCGDDTWTGVKCGGFDSELKRMVHVTELSVAEDGLWSSCGTAALTGASCVPLGGTLPEDLAMISTLTRLQVYRSRISGTLPRVFGRLTNLIGLIVEGNSLSGTLPTQMGAMTALGNGFGEILNLQLGSNRWSGTLPSQIGNLRNLTSLNFFEEGAGSISGTLPASLADMSSLQRLEISVMPLISGTIPSGLSLDQPSHNRSQDIFFDNPALKLSLAPRLSGTVPSALWETSYTQLGTRARTPYYPSPHPPPTGRAHREHPHASHLPLAPHQGPPAGD